MKFVACFTSRYWIARAESHIPIPPAVNIIIAINNGKKTMFEVGAIPYQSRKPPVNDSAMKKSNRFERTGAAGRIRRGKYTFVSTSTWAIRLVADAETDDEK